MELDAAEVWIRENLAVVKVDAVPFDKGCSPAKSEAPISPTSTTSASTQSPALHKFSYTRPPPFSLSLALPLTSSSDSATPTRRYIGGLTSSVTADQLISLFSTVILRSSIGTFSLRKGKNGGQYGFCQFKSVEDATRIEEAFDTQKVLGGNMYVSVVN